MLTREQIMELSGWELAAAVAVARGWEVDASKARLVGWGELWGIPPGHNRGHTVLCRRVDKVHDDIAAAWELVEEMTINLFRFISGDWQCTVFLPGPNIVADATTAPTAISRAYLLAKMEGDDERQKQHLVD